LLSWLVVRVLVVGLAVRVGKMLISQTQARVVVIQFEHQQGW
jgi:hypothetical protein